jgi:hypothetical protein
MRRLPKLKWARPLLIDFLSPSRKSWTDSAAHRQESALADAAVFLRVSPVRLIITRIEFLFPAVVRALPF